MHAVWLSGGDVDDRTSTLTCGAVLHDTLLQAKPTLYIGYARKYEVGILQYLSRAILCVAN